MVAEDNITTYSSLKPGFGVYLKKIWQYRSLISTFAKRDLKIKYAQTFLGIVWVLLAPFPSVLIFTFFFSMVVKIDTGNLPYPVFALTGMIGWGYFTNLTGGIGVSLIESQQLLKKIYFPKMILPLAKVLTGGVDFIVSFIVILIVMVCFGLTPSAAIVYFPFAFLLNILCGFTIGLWIAALTFRYRDMQHIAPNIINFSVWLTPVFYPTTLLPPSLSMVMYANPMAFVIAGYRFALSGSEPPSPHYLISLIPLFILLGTGIMYFRKIEDEVIEYI